MIGNGWRERLHEDLTDAGVSDENAWAITDHLLAAGWRWPGYGLDLIQLNNTINGFTALLADIKRKHVAEYEDHVRIARPKWYELTSEALGLHGSAVVAGVVSDDKATAEDES